MPRDSDPKGNITSPRRSPEKGSTLPAERHPIRQNWYKGSYTTPHPVGVEGRARISLTDLLLAYQHFGAVDSQCNSEGRYKLCLGARLAYKQPGSKEVQSVCYIVRDPGP